MNRIRGPLFFALFLAVFSLFGFVNYQNSEITRAQLREMLVQLGYDVKDLVKDPGKEKYSVTVTKGGLDIPIGYELSGNGRYIWLTVNLGDAPSESSAKNNALLKQNSKIQPTQFYITDSGRLMCALPVWNRNVNNADLRSMTDGLSDNVVKTEEVWKK